MSFETAIRRTSLVSAFVILAGCGGGKDLPVGGPYGGLLDPAAIVDGGLLGDGSGVLPVTVTETSAIGGTPTWAQLFTQYLASGTIGDCARGGCHWQMSTPATAFSFLQSQGYPPAALTMAGSFYGFSWCGGAPPMPPDDPTSPNAQKDFARWVAAGAMGP